MDRYISKSEELNKIIEQMYSAECDPEMICKDLDEVYLDQSGQMISNFRHEYSSISGKMKELYNEENHVFEIQYLLANIDAVYDCAVQTERPYVNGLFKLKDHIGLEAGRISLVEQLKWEIQQNRETAEVQLERFDDYERSIKDSIHRMETLHDNNERLEKQNTQNVEKAAGELEELNELVEEIEAKANGVQRDSITILGIFASIVLTFTGGMMFSTSVLENIGNASAYRVIIIALIIGFVLFNAIVALIMYIGKIIRVREKGKKAFLKDNLYWVVVNALFIALIGFTYVQWTNSSEKEVLDESNKYQIELYQKDTESLKEE